MIPSNYLTATDTQALLAGGKITTDQIIQDHHARYQERDAKVKAWVCVSHTRAAEDIMEGDLKGVVVGIKDIFNTKDFPTQHGSPYHTGESTGVDAPIVRILRAAGAHIIGKTTVDEFACATLEPLETYNPFDPAHRVGTSSAGSAAAVCDYQCHVALGTQTSASLARPSSYCGVFGFKPTYGTVSLEGVRPLDPRMDTLGLLARSITDIELVANVLGVFRCQPKPILHTNLKGAKFGFFKPDAFNKHASQGLKLVWEKAKQSLVEVGAIVEEIDLGEDFNGWEGTGGRYDKIVYTAGGISCDMEYKLDPKLVSKTVIERAENGIDRYEMVKIWDELSALRPRFDENVRRYDGIITPSSLVEAPRRDQDDVPDFCTLWTGLHVPTISIPGFGGESGLPIGLAMIGARYDDARLLGVAKLVAEVYIMEGEKSLRKVPAPEGVFHLRP